MKDDSILYNDDAEHVSLCRKGDTDAFELLVRRHQKRMLNVAYRMLGNYDDACEVVQDAFVSAFRHIGDFEGKSVFSTWLCSIVMNLSRNRLKQTHSRLRHEPLSLDDPVSTDDGFVKFDPPSDSPSVLEDLERKDLQEKIQRCIGNLEGDFRAVLVLRDIQGFSYDEIGEALKLAAGTVKSRLFRARESVRDCLKKVLGKL